MSRTLVTREAVERWHRTLCRVAGSMVFGLIKGNMSRSELLSFCTDLRETADEIERLAGD